MPTRTLCQCFIVTSAIVSAIKCGDGDTRCIEHSCSAFCSQWTCSHPDCPGCGPEVGCPDHPPPPPPPPPLPGAPPWSAGGVANGELHIVATGSKLFANGVELRIKGVNWFGSEGRSGPPLGLDKHEIKWYMKFLQDHNFNAVRLLFNHETILKDKTLEPPNEAIYGVGAPWEAPELENFKYIDMFGRIAEVAAEYGIVVMIACHRLNPAAWPGDGKWFDTTITEEKVKESWGKVATKLCRQWNVVAADLQNEPHASSWAKDMGHDSDWGHAAERIGDHVLSMCPRWLIMVEGVGYDPGAKDMDNGGAGIWWGENLAGAKVQPVVLSNPSKLAYTPHTYGPSVYMQNYFSASDFPANMPNIWLERFAFLAVNDIAPVVIGEMGGFYDTPGNPSGHDENGLDKIWQDWAINFCRDHSIGIFYFALNPGSDDTGGLLLDDWTTPVVNKLRLLARLPSTDILSVRARSFPSSPPPPSPPSPLPISPPPTTSPQPSPPLPAASPMPPSSTTIEGAMIDQPMPLPYALPNSRSKAHTSSHSLFALGLIAGGVVACCMVTSAGAYMLVRQQYGDILPSDEEKADRAEKRRRRRRQSKHAQSDSDDYSNDDDDDDDDDHEDDDDDDDEKDEEEDRERYEEEKDTAKVGKIGKAAAVHKGGKRQPKPAPAQEKPSPPAASARVAVPVLPPPAGPVQQTAAAESENTSVECGDHTSTALVLLGTSGPPPLPDDAPSDVGPDSNLLLLENKEDDVPSADTNTPDHRFETDRNPPPSRHAPAKPEEGDPFEREGSVVEKKSRALVMMDGEDTAPKKASASPRLVDRLAKAPSHGFDLD